ncbi:MAG: cyclic nucleotide-binding domain-containing protein [Demequinaceae bacterium]|nr:cyclic nucleotide-binding domain-containing protein [Demequinaceae bacterium]
MNTIKEIKDYLPEHPFFKGLDPDLIEFLAGCARNVHFSEGEIVFKEGAKADTFYVIRKGRVKIQVHHPVGGGNVFDTAEAGDVLGWTWLVPPYKWLFDATASEETSAVAFDGSCLRDKCENDPAVGYALMKRVMLVMYDRLRAARMRLLDLYGAGDG